MKKTKRSKEISIYVILIIVIALTSLFFCVKTNCFSNNENLELSSIQTENIADTETENSILLIKLDEEQEKTEEEKKEVIPIQDNDDDDRQVLSADKK